MTIDKIEQNKNSDFKFSAFASKPKSKEEENILLRMKQEDIENKRASQRNLDIYRLSLQAKDGNCNAIRKLLNYDFKDFDLSGDFAQKIDKEASQMLCEQRELYENSYGGLTDDAQEAVYAQIEKEQDFENEAQKERKANDLMDKMTTGFYSI